MPTKKTAAAGATKKSSSAAPAHASYKDMIKEAILNLKERNGSSRQAIKKYIKANNNLGATTDAQFSSQINRALATGEANGEFARPKGASGPVKLAKKDATKKAAVSKDTKTKTAKPAAKKATKTEGEKKKAAPKKKATTAATKTAAKPKKTKAAASKPAAAPAVEDKVPVVLGKTKSGRVTKTKAPVAVAKKVAPKKAAAKKASTKKSATPKKEAAAS